MTGSPTETEKRSRHWPVKRIVQTVLSVAVVGIFVFAIPKIADYSAVWKTITSMTWLELTSLVAATIFNLFTYWWANMAALPGLTLGRSAVVTQTTTSVSNTLPAGGAVGVGLTYSILGSWGFEKGPISLYVLVTGVWNIFMKLALPVISLGLLAATGQLTSSLVIAAVIGVAMLLVALVLFGLMLWKKSFARRIGDRLGRMLSFFMKLVRRPPVLEWGEAAVRFRRETIDLVVTRWVWITLTTVLSHLASTSSCCCACAT